MSTIPTQNVNVNSPPQNANYATSSGDGKNLQYIQQKYGQNSYQSSNIPIQTSNLGTAHVSNHGHHNHNSRGSSSSS
jgi:hypothetical protein